VGCLNAGQDIHFWRTTLSSCGGRNGMSYLAISILFRRADAWNIIKVFDVFERTFCWAPAIVRGSAEFEAELIFPSNADRLPRSTGIRLTVGARLG